MEKQIGLNASGTDKPLIKLLEEEAQPAEPEALSAPPAAQSGGDLLADTLEQGKQLLNEHKGKLAIGVAATLGLTVYYKWREKKLAEDDPEEYARLQRIKAGVRHQDEAARQTDRLKDAGPD